MPFPNVELPPDFDVPCINEKPRHRGTENLRHVGRPKGAQDKISRDLKNGILDAAIAHGADGEGEGGLGGYLFLLAAEHKKTFGNLLMKLLPMNLTGSVEQSLVGTVKIVSIPSGTFLNREQMAAATAGEPFTIDHKPQLEHPEEPASIAPVEIVEESTLDPELSPAMRRAMEMGYRPLPRRPQP